MSASREVRFKIGADTSALSRGFIQAQSIAAAAGRQIGKKLGLQDAFKATVIALGLSIDKIAERVASVFSGGSAEQWSAALGAAERTAQIMEDAMFNRLSLLKQIDALEARIAQNKPNENPSPWQPGTLTGWRRILFDSPAGLEWMRRLGLGGETDAEAAARSQGAIGKRTADDVRLEDLREKRRRNEERIADARRDLANTGLEGQDKINALLKEADLAGERLAKARSEGKDSAELELIFVSKLKSVKQEIYEFEKKAADEAEARAQKEKQRLEKQQRDREQFVEKFAQYLKAQDKVSEARQAIREARHDNIAFGLDEAAGGTRGNSRDRARAREIQRLEDRARRLYDSGATITEFDAATQRNVRVTGADLMNRAEQLRAGFGRAKTADQQPFRSVEDALKEANQYLYEIQESLKTTAVD